MQTIADSLLQAALKLPENERLDLVSSILNTTSKEDAFISLDDVAFVEEMDRRFADREETVTWSELRAKK